MQLVVHRRVVELVQVPPVVAEEVLPFVELEGFREVALLEFAL